MNKGVSTAWSVAERTLLPLVVAEGIWRPGGGSRGALRRSSKWEVLGVLLLLDVKERPLMKPMDSPPCQKGVLTAPASVPDGYEISSPKEASRQLRPVHLVPRSPYIIFSVGEKGGDGLDLYG
jgi:hypothetical protein